MTFASAASRVTATSRLTALRVPPTVALSFAVIALVIAWSLVPGLFTSQSPVNGIPADKLLGPGGPFAKPAPQLCAFEPGHST